MNSLSRSFETSTHKPFGGEAEPFCFIDPPLSEFDDMISPSSPFAFVPECETDAFEPLTSDAMSENLPEIRHTDASTEDASSLFWFNELRPAPPSSAPRHPSLPTGSSRCLLPHQFSSPFPSSASRHEPISPALLPDRKASTSVSSIVANSCFSSWHAADFSPIHQASDYRQLELRAIFSVGHEMDAVEILERTRALPGVRHAALLWGNEWECLDSLRNALRAQDFRTEALRLFNGHTSIDFFRHGQTTLAVQMDAAYPPGLHEMIMIVARELNALVSVDS